MEMETGLIAKHTLTRAGTQGYRTLMEDRRTDVVLLWETRAMSEQNVLVASLGWWHTGW
jgi:hypothetical protein